VKFRNRQLEADTPHAVTMPECEQYSFVILYGDGVTVVHVIDDKGEWKRVR